MRVPILEKTSSRRSRMGDLIALLILAAIVAGVGWLWWHSRQTPAKPDRPASHKPASTVPNNPIRPPVHAMVARQPAAAAVSANYPRPVRDVLEAQIALMRRAISPGPVDGAMGSQTRVALAIFQRGAGLGVTGVLDSNTQRILTLDSPPWTEHIVRTNDLTRLQPVGKTWLEKSRQSALDYETLLELVAEKAHAHPLLIQRLNPDVDWTNVVAGARIVIPAATYPEPAEAAAFVTIHLASKTLQAYGAQSNLLLHCPCSIAARVEKRPVGSLKVATVAPNPNYTFDPAVFPESAEAQELGRKLILQPGPNNPVGVAWIGLDRPGYGMHGTPVPEQVGRTESHGCFRLANWDAAYLVELVQPGMNVEVAP